MIDKEHKIKITLNKEIGFNTLRSILLKGLKKELNKYTDRSLNVYIENLI